ncbi:MAG: hypothetical protein U1D00_07655, partial [Mycobacterium sp.]|nr:hypothetical protein [Mycobacterium sp.]
CARRRKSLPRHRKQPGPGMIAVPTIGVVAAALEARVATGAAARVVQAPAGTLSARRRPGYLTTGG